MRRLYKIGFNYGLASLIPIISWFILGILVDKDLANIFSLTYPLQFIWGILANIFGTGALVHQSRDNNDVAIKSGIILSIVVGAIVFGFVILNIESYTSMMSMVGGKYQLWGIYSIILLYLQLVQGAVFNRYYYEGKDNVASRYCILCNIGNLIALVVFSMVFQENQVLIVVFTLSVSTLETGFLVYKGLKNSNKGFKYSLSKCFKYESSSILSNTLFFLIFSFGLSNAMSYGSDYTTAINFVALVTDTQWDILVTLSTVAKLDIAQGRFNMHQSVVNGYKFEGLLTISILVMFVGFGLMLGIPWGLSIIYLSSEFFNLAVFPYARIRLVYIQLEYSAKKATYAKLCGDSSRLACSFLATPFCGSIGQVVSSTIQFLMLGSIYRKSKREQGSKDNECVVK